MYFDETETPDTEIYDGEDTSVDAPELEYNTTYYWQVVPYNEEGDAEDVPVWSFTTMEDQTITEVPYQEDFNDVEPPALPLGWLSHIEATSDAVVETPPGAAPIPSPTTFVSVTWQTKMQSSP